MDAITPEHSRSQGLCSFYVHGSLGLLPLALLLLILGKQSLTAGTLPRPLVSGYLLLLDRHKGWILPFELLLGDPLLCLAQDQVLVIEEHAVAGIVG
jgi:hypothetical protein